MAGLGALPKAIIPLGIEQTLLVKTGKLELMVYVGGQDKIIFAFYQFQQITVRHSHAGS